MLPGPISSSLIDPTFGKLYAGIASVAGATSYNWYINGGLSTFHGTAAQFSIPRGVCDIEYDISVEEINSCGISSRSYANAYVPCDNYYMISPNPASGAIIVSSDNSKMSSAGNKTFDEVRIYDMQGNLKKHQKFDKVKSALYLSGKIPHLTLLGKRKSSIIILNLIYQGRRGFHGVHKKQVNRKIRIRKMKHFGSFLLCLLLFSSCISDEERRLQTDQSFEGEEMFNISFSLDEHLFYAFQPFEFYKDTLNYDTISGCPTVDINEEIKEVSLEFGEGDCTTNSPGRRGKLILTFPDSLSIQDKLIRIGYEGYSVRGINLEGIRYLDQVDSTSTGLAFYDIPKLMFIDANKSTSKVNGEFTHHVIFSDDSIQQITSFGSASGRNLAGRPFKMEISQPKTVLGDCITNGFFVAESGEESWTFERTGEPDVKHIISYQPAAECNNTALIQLSDGRTLRKTL